MRRRSRLLLLLSLGAGDALQTWQQTPRLRQVREVVRRPGATAETTTETSTTKTTPTKRGSPVVEDVSREWELDCFSRPVTGADGKKLWELLVTDRTGQWREVVELPATAVNSVTVREAVEEVIRRAPVAPATIRFFRKSMLNMLSIALRAVAENRAGLRVVRSRRTHALFAWLDERNERVYPAMPGYDVALDRRKRRAANDYGFDWVPPRSVTDAAGRLPDGLRGEQYAFVTLPLAEVLPGGGVTADNVGVGELLDVTSVVDDNTLDLSSKGLSPQNDATRDATMLPGVALLTRRADALAMSLASLEIAALRSAARQLVLDVGLDQSYLLAKLDDTQRDEAAAFEKTKDSLNGLHFLVVQRPDDDASPAGFWLLRDVDPNDF